jgi:hypothetical protein
MPTPKIKAGNAIPPFGLFNLQRKLTIRDLHDKYTYIQENTDY